MSNPKLYARNRRKRVAGWTAFYLVLLAAFIFVIIWQSHKVNIYQFPNGVIQLSVSKAKYTVGQTVAFEIHNGLSNSIQLVNKCPNPPLHIYQWESGQWIGMSAAAKNSNCNGQHFIAIKPGQTYKSNYKNWPKLFNKPGIYRVVAFASNYTALPYADFQIVGKQIQQAPKIIYKPVYTPVYTPVYVKSGGDGGGGGDN